MTEPTTHNQIRLACGEVLRDNKGRQWVVIDRWIPKGADGAVAYAIALMEQGESQVQEVNAELMDRWISSGTMRHVQLEGLERIMRRWYG